MLSLVSSATFRYHLLPDFDVIGIVKSYSIDLITLNSETNPSFGAILSVIEIDV
jgi:hypothetical protein